MGRQLIALVVALGCVLAVQPAAPAAPADPVYVTLSNHRPVPGERVTVWFKFYVAHKKVTVYLDRPGNAPKTVTTSSTGYGHSSFTIPATDKPGTQHELNLVTYQNHVTTFITTGAPGSHTDRQTDVRTTPGTGEEVFQPDPHRKLGDITGTRVALDRSKVRIVTYYRGLAREGRRYSYLFAVKTADRERYLRIDTFHGNWAGTLSLTKPAGSARAATSTAADEPASCPGITFLIDYPHNRSIVNVPRSCLNFPEFVRVGGAFFSSQSNTVESYDDAYDAKSDPIDGGLTLSAPVHR